MAQKKLIDNETYKTWKTLQQYNISNDGKYAWYEYGTAESTVRTLVACTTNGKYKREFPRAWRPIFTADSHRLVFYSTEGISILEMSKDTLQCIKHGGDFSIPQNGNGRWLSYHIDNSIILKDMISGKERRYSNATGAWFNVEGTILLVQTSTALLWVSMPGGEERTILHGTSTNDIAFDTTGNRVVFIASGSQGNVLCYYQPGMDSAAIQVTGNSAGIRRGFIISDEVPRFSQDGQNIFFKLGADTAAAITQRDSTLITDKVNVWHYKDKYLLSQQLEAPWLKLRTYTAIVPINTGKVIQLESRDTTLGWLPDNPGKYILASNIVNDTESYWNKDHIANYQLVSLPSDSRKNILPANIIHSCQLSPGEQFVTWWDPMKKHYFSYEVATAVIRNITQVVKIPLHINDEHPQLIQDYAFGIAGWLAGDSGLLIYDRYDIWQVDPMNRKLPVNITGGYGRLHRITFRLIEGPSGQITTDTLLLVALKRDNKYNGFWKTQPETSTAPISCSNMTPSLYYSPDVGFNFNARPPIKAKNAQVYLVQRMSATEASNLFTTTDFHSFIPLSDIHPQKEYNWMTTGLIHWEMPNGTKGEGILYKPENFDPKKKYPLIFYYYEKRSNELFTFQNPALSNGTLNIPWFVSNGYLVCVPDIYYTIGHTGQSIVNSVVSAANYLCTFPWVDATKMGLQGHSFGGYETNYLVTHSSLFAAAQESAGASDIISKYGSISYGGRSAAFQCETGQTRLGTTPWQRPDVYVENSPVFSVDKIKTPLLIMHNKGDEAVPFAQALEMFTALRRLQKPVWLLQYDGEGHILTDPACKLDFTIRQQQFFNHYLKGFAAPEWMTKGIPAERKGTNSGIRLDLNH